MATWIVGLVLIGAVYFASRYVLRASAGGGCAGCGSSCCHCGMEKKMHAHFKK